MPLGATLTYTTEKLNKLRNHLEANQCIDGDREKKNGTLAKNFHKPAGGVNRYAWFGYGPLKICNHTRGQVSASMIDDAINMIHTSQQ